jgi:hypothetical protein
MYLILNKIKIKLLSLEHIYYYKIIKNLLLKLINYLKNNKVMQIKHKLMLLKKNNQWIKLIKILLNLINNFKMEKDKYKFYLVFKKILLIS